MRRSPAYCRECGKHGKVYGTIHVIDESTPALRMLLGVSYVRRRRRCANKHRWTTVEIDFADMPQMSYRSDAPDTDDDETREVETTDSSIQPVVADGSRRA